MNIATDNLIGPYVEAVSKTQDVIVNGAKAWAELVRSTPNIRFGKEIPNAVELVDGAFDRAEQVFALQRKVARGVAEAYAPITEKVTAAWTDVLGKVPGTALVPQTEETPQV